MLVEVVNHADETIAVHRWVGLVVPEAAEAWRRGRFSRPLQARQCIRGDVANPTGPQHGDDVSSSGMPLAHP